MTDRSHAPQTHFIHLKNTVLTPELQTYISAALQHITSLYSPLATVKEETESSSKKEDVSRETQSKSSQSEKVSKEGDKDQDADTSSKKSTPSSNISKENVYARKKVISFLPQRNGILLIGFEDELVDIIWKWIKQMDRVVGRIRVDLDLVLLESHRMTSGFKY